MCGRALPYINTRMYYLWTDNVFTHAYTKKNSENSTENKMFPEWKYFVRVSTGKKLGNSQFKTKKSDIGFGQVFTGEL